MCLHCAFTRMEDIKRARERASGRGEWVRWGDIIIIHICLYTYILYYTTIADNIMSPAENYCD